MQRSARAKQAGWSKRMSERCEQTSKRTSEWPSTYVPILGVSNPSWEGREGEEDTKAEAKEKSEKVRFDSGY